MVALAEEHALRAHQTAETEGATLYGALRLYRPEAQMQVRNAWYRHEVGGQVLYVSPTRIYMPEDGRFLSRDPIEKIGGMSYGYRGVNWVDPDGRNAVLDQMQFLGKLATLGAALAPVTWKGKSRLWERSQPQERPDGSGLDTLLWDLNKRNEQTKMIAGLDGDITWGPARPLGTFVPLGPAEAPDHETPVLDFLIGTTSVLQDPIFFVRDALSARFVNGDYEPQSMIARGMMGAVESGFSEYTVIGATPLFVAGTGAAFMHPATSPYVVTAAAGYGGYLAYEGDFEGAGAFIGPVLVGQTYSFVRVRFFPSRILIGKGYEGKVYVTDPKSTTVTKEFTGIAGRNSAAVEAQNLATARCVCPENVIQVVSTTRGGILRVPKIVKQRVFPVKPPQAAESELVGLMQALEAGGVRGIIRKNFVYGTTADCPTPRWYLIE